MEQLKQYIYMDVDGINSLYAQIVNDVAIEQEVETEKRYTGAAKGTFSAKVKELFTTDVNLSGERETAHTFRQKTILPDERKLQLLQDYIIKHENLIKEYGKIEAKYQTSCQNFVLISTAFDTMLDCRDWSNAMRQIGQFGYVPLYKAPFEVLDGYDYRDSYYKTQAMHQTKVTMNLGVQKMRDYSSFGMTSHLAHMFRVFKGHNIPLGVFGHVYRLTENIYQIKPYAVWRVS